VGWNRTSENTNCGSAAYVASGAGSELNLHL